MDIKIGDKVQTGVFIMDDFIEMYSGIVVGQSPDGTISDVDVMSLHGGAPWIKKEQTTHLRKML